MIPFSWLDVQLTMLLSPIPWGFRAILCAGGDSQLLHGKLHFEEVRPEAQQMQCKGSFQLEILSTKHHWACINIDLPLVEWNLEVESCPSSIQGSYPSWVFSWTFHPQLLQMYPVTVAMVRKKMKMWPPRNHVRTSSRTTHQQLNKNWEKLLPTWFFQSPMSLRASSSVLGLHFLRLDNSKQQKFQKTSPKLCKTKRMNHFITRRYKMCITTTFTSHIFLVSLLLFCVKGTSFHQQLVSAAWLKLGEHYAQGGLTAGLCGSQTRGLSRNGPRGKLGNSIKNRLQTHICGSFQRYQ